MRGQESLHGLRSYLGKSSIYLKITENNEVKWLTSYSDPITLQMHDYGKGFILTQHEQSSRNHALLQLWMENYSGNFGWDGNRKGMETDTASHLSTAFTHLLIYKCFCTKLIDITIKKTQEYLFL